MASVDEGFFLPRSGGGWKAPAHSAARRAASAAPHQPRRIKCRISRATPRRAHGRRGPARAPELGCSAGSRTVNANVVARVAAVQRRVHLLLLILVRAQHAAYLLRDRVHGAPPSLPLVLLLPGADVTSSMSHRGPTNWSTNQVPKLYWDHGWFFDLEGAKQKGR